MLDASYFVIDQDSQEITVDISGITSGIIVDYDLIGSFPDSVLSSHTQSRSLKLYNFEFFAVDEVISYTIGQTMLKHAIEFTMEPDLEIATSVKVLLKNGDDLPYFFRFN